MDKKQILLEEKQKEENRYTIFKKMLADSVNDDQYKIHLKDVDLVSTFQKYINFYVHKV